MLKNKLLHTAAVLAAFFTPVAAFAQASKNPAISQGTVPWVTQLNIGGSAISTSNPVPMSIQSGGIAAGTAGTASADVLSVQGVTSMTPLRVQGGLPATISGSATDTVTPALDFSMDGYPSVVIGVSSAGSGNTAQIQGCIDYPTCATWVPIPGTASSGVQTSGASSTTTPVTVTTNLSRLRVILTAYGSGTYTAYAQRGFAAQPPFGQPSINSGENHIGEAGSNVYTSTVTPTTTAVTYTAGQSAGGLLTFTNMVRVSGTLGNPGTGGVIQSAIAANKSTLSSGGWDLWLFSANPTASTCTNATAWSLAAADIGKVINVINLNAGNTSAAGTAFLPSTNVGNGNSALGSGIWYALSSSTTMYGCLVARASMAVGTTSDLSISVTTNRL